MTLVKKIIIKLILTKRYQIASFFLDILGGACPQTPLAKGMASLSCDYMQRFALIHANLHFRKKSLISYQILYTFLAYMYILIKEIKYIF